MMHVIVSPFILYLHVKLLCVILNTDLLQIDINVINIA